MKRFLVNRLELGFIEANSFENAQKLLIHDGFNCTTSEEEVLNEDNPLYDILSKLDLSSIREIIEENKSLKEKLERSVSWSVEDFEGRADDIEEEGGFILFDRDKFKDALYQMIYKHDASIGISWETIDFYLSELCYTNFNLEFGDEFKQLTFKKFLEVWEKEPVFVFNLSEKTERQINDQNYDGKLSELQLKAIWENCEHHGNILIIENKEK